MVSRVRYSTKNHLCDIMKPARNRYDIDVRKSLRKQSQTFPMKTILVSSLRKIIASHEDRSFGDFSPSPVTIRFRPLKCLPIALARPQLSSAAASE